jgi:hypothetical protein
MCRLFLCCSLLICGGGSEVGALLVFQLNGCLIMVPVSSYILSYELVVLNAEFCCVC